MYLLVYLFDYKMFSQAVIDDVVENFSLEFKCFVKQK